MKDNQYTERFGSWTAASKVERKMCNADINLNITPPTTFTYTSKNWRIYFLMSFGEGQDFLTWKV